MSTITRISVSSSPAITFRWEGAGETLNNPQTVPAALTVLQGSTLTGPGVVPNPNVASPFTLAGWSVGQFSELVAGSDYEVVLTPPAPPGAVTFTFQTGQVVTIAFTLQTTTADGVVGTSTFTATAIVDAPYGQVINSITAAAAPVQQDLSFLTGFPFQVYDSYAMPPGGGGGVTAAPSAQAMVDAQMKAVLGRSTGTGGVAGTLAALDRSFQMVVADGVDTWVWQPQSYAVQSDIGAGVTGEQASIARLAASVGDEILPLISGLTPLVPEAFVNPDEIAAAKSIISSSWPAFVTELSNDGGPRIIRATSLLQDAATQLVQLGILLGMYAPGTTLPTSPPESPPEGPGFVLDVGFNPLDPTTWPVPDRTTGVVTADDEANYTNFVIATDRVTLVAGQFQKLYSSQLGPPSPPEDRGFLVVLLQRALEAAGEAADGVYAALDSVSLGRDEREVIYLLPGQPGSLSVEDVISWAATFPAQEAAPLLQNAGNVGIQSITTRATALQTAVVDVTNLTVPPAPPGMKHPRVTFALALLTDTIGEVLQTAQNASLAYQVPAGPGD